MRIPLHKPDITAAEMETVQEVLESGEIGGAGEYDRACAELIESAFEAENALMTTGCTHALEMAAMLLGIEEGDEVIVPSFTFPATATAFVLHGAKPVFVDVKEDTLNIDPAAVEEAVTERTTAIIPVHYGGVAADLARLQETAEEHGLAVVEDAAQGVNARYEGDYLGTRGDIGCYSFHATKSYVAGVGGAIIVPDRYRERAEILRQTGTDYEQFRRGDVDYYTWVDVGSSYAPSEIQAALAHTQLQRREEIRAKKAENAAWYREELDGLAEEDLLHLPHVPDNCETNHHLFYIRVQHREEREALLQHLNRDGIGAAVHYQPLHTSKMGKTFGFASGDLPVTEQVADTLIRLPMFPDLEQDQVKDVAGSIRAFFEDDAR